MGLNVTLAGRERRGPVAVGPRKHFVPHVFHSEYNVSHPPSRRDALRALTSTVVAGTAGCLDGNPLAGPSTEESPFGTDRPDRTPRTPQALDVAGAWPQAGGDAARTGVSASAGPSESGSVFWRLGPDRSGRAVLAEGRLFHYARIEGAWLVARDARDGGVRWSARLDGSGDGSVGSDGAVAGWPAVTDDAVVTAGRQLSAFGVESGDRGWSEDLGVPDTGDRLPGSPAIVESAVVVGVPGRDAGEVRVHGLGDGAHRWTAALPNRGAWVAVDDGVVVAVSPSFGGTSSESVGEASAVRALALDGGDELWSTTVRGDATRGPVLAGGAAYVSSGGVVRALALADGEELWRRSFDGTPADLAADGERVFVGAGETLAVLGASDGSVHWTAASRDHSFGTPAVGADAVYAGTEGANGRLFAFDASDGTELWTHSFPATVVAGDVATAGVVAQPTVADGAVYVPAVDGIYAFGGEMG